MNDTSEQENTTPAPKHKNADKTEIKFNKPQKKSSGFLVFIFCILFALIFCLSPSASYIIPYLPKPIVEHIIAPVHQEIILSDTETTFDKPVKLSKSEPLMILGINSGICFTFATSKTASKRKKALAEVIAVGSDKNEYALKEISIAIEKNENGKKITHLCQKFGKAYSIPPESVTAIFIRPFTPFTSSRTTWKTTKTIH